MPSDVIAIAISTGIGVSVFAGVLSGVCYVLAHGFTRRCRKSDLQWYCVVCGTYLRSHVKGNIKVIICVECEERACKHQCSKRDYTKKQWVCYNCLKRPSWLQNVITSIPWPYKKIKKSEDIVGVETEQMGKKLDHKTLKSEKEKQCVRDFIEKCVFTIVGGTVDDASIFRIYNDKHYQAFFNKYHQDLSDAITSLSLALQLSIENSSCCEQNPSEAHTGLKSLIETIIKEAARLPKFHNVANPTPDQKNERTYEELLATAILNKVINNKEHSRLESSEDNTPSHKLHKKSFSTHEWETDWRDLESTSSSSVDDYLYSDSSHSSVKYVDHVSLKIHQRIEEILQTSPHEDGDDSLQYLQYGSSSSLNSQQSNWYLQKRRIHGTNSPVPVPMLVPNPLTSAKVLIGDKEADETSDLSDANSEDISDPGVQNLMVKSTLLIGQKHGYVSDEETSFDSGVRDDKDDFSERDKLYFTETPQLVEDQDIERVISPRSDAEKDSEYTEQFSSLPTAEYTHLPEDYGALSWSRDQLDGNKIYDHIDSEEPYQETENIHIFQGIYSKKEKDKWKHPIDMPNNPYSEENIRRRIQSNQRYGRDYYTKQASLPSGSLKSEETNNAFWTFEDTDVYKAYPATTITEVEIQHDENYAETNHHEQNEYNEESRVDLHANRDTDPFDFFHQPFTADNKQLKITVNEKKVSDSENLIQKDAPDAINTVTNSFQTAEHHNISEVSEEPIQTLDLPVQSAVVTSNKISNEITFKSQTSIQASEDPLAKENQIKNDHVSTAFVAKKSDNTLIRKIYSNPVVRSFALKNREKIPYFSDTEINIAAKSNVKDEPKNYSKSEPEVSIKDEFKTRVKDKPESNVKSEPKTIEPSAKVDNNVPKSVDDNLSLSENESEVAKYNFSLEFSDNESPKKQESVQSDNDYNELKKKRLVSNLIGEYSKSFPNLTRINYLKYNKNTNTVNDSPKKHTENQQVENVESNETSFVSVKDLKKLFENNNDVHRSRDKPVHSLTARSISKEIKNKLITYSENKTDTQSREEEHC